ncbi:MAG: GtrA family protein [Cyanobacteriota bacterium ELA615]|jgi:putative flippase GtrA
MNSSPVQKLVKFIKKHTFIRFLLVGVLNTAFSYLLYASLILIGLKYLLAFSISYVAGVLFNFQTIGKLVFKNKNNKLLFRFVGVYVVIYLLNAEGLRIADALNINIEYKTKMLIASAILVVPMAMVSFVLNKLFVFRE